jgi:H+/Cl- antiporter ClcA
VFEVVPHLPDPGAYAIAGAAAFMAATGRLSLFFTVIMMEATGYLSFALPILIGAIFATWTGNLFNHGLYHILMKVANPPFTSPVFLSTSCTMWC